MTIRIDDRIWHGITLSGLIKERGIHKIAEIGVNKQHLTKHLLKHNATDITEYWAIDPWGQGEGCALEKNTESRWHSLYVNACKSMVTHSCLRA